MLIASAGPQEREHLEGHVRDILAARALPLLVRRHPSDTLLIRLAPSFAAPDGIPADHAAAAVWDAFRTAWADVEMARTEPQGVSGSCGGAVHALCAVPWCGCCCHPVRAARVMVDDLVAWGLPKDASAQARRVFGGKESCHLTVDGPLVVLHAFAERIGLRRAWYQDHPLMKHYDLTAKRREAAIRAGAVYVSGMAQARARRAKREAAAQQGTP